MKLFIDTVMKRIYLFNIVAWNYRKKMGFPVCKKQNFANLRAHRKRGKSARASSTPHHTLNEGRSARFTAQHLSALLWTFPLKIFKKLICGDAYYLNLSEFSSNVQLTFWAVFTHERNRKTVLQVSTYHFVQQLFCQVKVPWVDDVSSNTNFITSGQNRDYSPSVFRSSPEQRKEIISTAYNAICSC